jgi:hypothetical protein
MYFSLTSFCLAILICGTVATAAVKESEKLKASIIAHDVTLDGHPRPDLSRALTDAFTSALLKSGHYRVYSSEILANPTPKTKIRHQDMSELMLGNTANKLTITKTSPLDHIFTFNLLGEKSRYSLSVKKVDAKTQEVLQTQEITSTGSWENVCLKLKDTLLKLDERKSSTKSPFPWSLSPSEIRELRKSPPIAIQPTTTKKAPRNPGTAGGVPMEYAEENLAVVPKALVYRKVGTVVSTNQPWKFAIIQPENGQNLGVSDTVQVLWDHNQKTYSQLRVSNYDNGKVITDFGNNAAHHHLYQGDSVYGWTVPKQ